MSGTHTPVTLNLRIICNLSFARAHSASCPILAHSDWKKHPPFKKRLKSRLDGGTIGAGAANINNPIEQGHPADIAFGAKELSPGQQEILDKLPEYGSQAIVRKRDVSMLDLSALTAKTGDEFAMFTRKGYRLIVRGDIERVPVNSGMAKELRDAGYRCSGHTHPGFSDASLIASDGDRLILAAFGQDSSSLYNAAGRRAIVKSKET